MIDKTVSGGNQGTSAKVDTSPVGDSAPSSDAGGEFEPASGPDREFVGTPRVRAYLQALGPGLITGASDDDPSGIATYAQAGAQFGFAMLWVALLTLPLMMGIQEICDRTALASGKTLGELITVHFGRVLRAVIGVLIAVLVVANALNIAADLVAVGQGMHLLHAGPSAVWALIAGASITALLAAGSFLLIARVFKVLCTALLAYVAVLLLVHIPWGTVVVNTVIPHVQLSSADIALLVAVLGTTISPYLFFWQAMHRVEDMREEQLGGEEPVPLRRRGQRARKSKQLMSRLDVFTGMAFSNIVMFAIITATAATLGRTHHLSISSPAQAAEALRPLGGQIGSYVFALGFIGSGMLAIPVLAGAGSAAMSGLIGKGAGFSNSLREAPVFYGLCAVGTIGGMALSLASVNPIKLLVLVAIINGVTAGPFLIVVMRISSDRTIMGESINGALARWLGWGTAGLMLLAAVALFATGGA
jgi:NRAMP (natural resistance-associated macrophage protein)-like metal ion transporter